MVENSLAVGRPRGAFDYGGHGEPRRSGRGLGGHRAECSMAVRGRCRTWEQSSRLQTLSSSSEWSFLPRPDTHHVRWIARHPLEPERLWVAIEAGALVSTIDGGRTWRDRVPGGPWDTHELAVHPSAPDTLRVSAGDGYFESYDAGITWRSPSAALDVGYLRSVAIIPVNRKSLSSQALSWPDSADRSWSLGWPVVSTHHSRSLGARP